MARFTWMIGMDSVVTKGKFNVTGILKKQIDVDR